MKHLRTYVFPAILGLVALQANAQNEGRVEATSQDGVIRFVAGLGASTMAESVTHEFIAQRPGENYPRILYITNKGKVGIGLNANPPRSMLSVGTGLYNVSADEIGSTRYNNPRGYMAGIPNGGACVGFNAARQADAAVACEADATNTHNGGALIWADGEGSLSFSALPSNGGATGNATGLMAQYFFPNDIVSYRVMKLRPLGGGQVQIGQMLPSAHADYRLAVDGKLVAKSIFVTQGTNWADLFEPTYALQPLPELEAYLKQNRHLPAIPSAAEVEQNGLNLGDINARLLQSLEELTLHVIELGKQNARLQAEVTALAARVNQAAAPVAGK